MKTPAKPVAPAVRGTNTGLRSSTGSHRLGRLSGSYDLRGIGGGSSRWGFIEMAANRQRGAVGPKAGLFECLKSLVGQGLGFLSPAGIVINRGLVLIEFIEHLMKEKLEKGEGLAAEGQRSIAGLSREAFHQCVIGGGRLR